MSKQAKYEIQKARTERNKARKQKKYQVERDKRKGTSSKESKEVKCSCGKTVQIRRYKCKGGSYTCIACRVKAEPFKFKEAKRKRK